MVTVGYPGLGWLSSAQWLDTEVKRVLSGAIPVVVCRFAYELLLLLVLASFGLFFSFLCLLCSGCRVGWRVSFVAGIISDMEAPCVFFIFLSSLLTYLRYSLFSLSRAALDWLEVESQFGLYRGKRVTSVGDKRWPSNVALSSLPVQY